MARHSLKIYKYPLTDAEYAFNFHYYVVYLNFILASDSLTNLKKEIKNIEKCHGVNIFSLWKDGFRQKEPVLVTHYKPRGLKND